MRDLKFRLWHNGEMYLTNLRWGSSAQHGSGWLRAVPFGEELRLDVLRDGNDIQLDPNDCEIMQFTGLLDKDGKEIYEGDIVTCDAIRDLEVYWNEYGVWAMRDARANTAFSDANLKAFFIVGNIYEHPRLLQKEAA